ncbi:hypothetical protein CKQ84_18925 [Shewanella sp. WE21]|jgi:hypothetical protein|uniref:hypothetical protein n=1 Tax=Shewanella sp. WE21 TaxID=2029986 RepID=UPI000CF6D6DF|nr:hypothetical protein [Shewanella sp. WE21]AVI67750.1 hypothetical protein CKQ84_18925 [Shewanella sp. WE21]
MAIDSFVKLTTISTPFDSKIKIDKNDCHLDINRVTHTQHEPILSQNINTSTPNPKLFTPKPYSKEVPHLKSGKEIFSFLIDNNLSSSKSSASERALDAIASGLSRVLNTAADVDLNGKKMFVKNFLQCDQNEAIKVTSAQFSPIHQAEIYSRLSICFDGFMTSMPNELGKDLNSIRSKLSNNEKLNGSEEQRLFERLAKDALADAKGNNLYTNKLLKPENFVLEFPGDAAVVKTDTEAKNNKILVEQLGFPRNLLDRPSANQHETYAIKVFTNEKGESVTLGQLFGGGLQGIMRTPVDPGKFEQSDFKGYFNEELLASGGLHFDFRPNETMYQNNLAVLGQDILDLAVNLNLDNHSRADMEGFTAGVSGNALHYTIQTAKHCLATNKEFNFEQVLNVCLEHLVGDSVKQPVHHSLPEVIQGAYIGKMLINKGILSPHSNIMDSNEIYGSLRNVISEADQRISNQMATTYHRE